MYARGSTRFSLPLAHLRLAANSKTSSSASSPATSGSLRARFSKQRRGEGITVLRVKDVLRLNEGEPGGVEAIPGQLWWTLKARSIKVSNEMRIDSRIV